MHANTQPQTKGTQRCRASMAEEGRARASMNQPQAAHSTAVLGCMVSGSDAHCCTHEPRCEEDGSGCACVDWMDGKSGSGIKPLCGIPSPVTQATRTFPGKQALQKLLLGLGVGHQLCLRELRREVTGTCGASWADHGHRKGCRYEYGGTGGRSKQSNKVAKK